MSEHSLLRSKRWDFLVEGHRPIVEEVQARETVLLSSEIDLALGKSSRRARSTTTKDLTSIVGRLAKGIAGFESQLVPQLRGTEFRLQPVVVGIAGVRAGSDD